MEHKLLYDLRFRYFALQMKERTKRILITSLLFR